MNKIYKFVALIAVLHSPCAFCNSIIEVSESGEIEYFDQNKNPVGTLSKDKLPSLPIPVIEVDEVAGLVKVKAKDNNLIWLNILNVDLESDSKTIIKCKSAETGKSKTVVAAVNMGFGECMDIK